MSQNNLATLISVDELNSLLKNASEFIAKYRLLEANVGRDSLEEYKAYSTFNSSS